MRYFDVIKSNRIIQLEVEIVALTDNLGKSNVKATANDVVVAEGKIAFTLIDRPARETSQLITEKIIKAKSSINVGVIN